MRFHTIVTHESPDLDAMLCCYLLKKYGENRYPGITGAEIQFYPAGRLPEGKTPEELEKQGTLLVDIGGGRLDTHPDGQHLDSDKAKLSAANLVAIDLDVHKKPSLLNLLEFIRLQDSTGKSLTSRNPVDHLVSLPNLVRGALLNFGENFLEMLLFFMGVFESIELAKISEGSNYEEVGPYLISMDEESCYIPSAFNIKSLFAAYLAREFLSKKNLTITLEPMGKVWRDLEEFVHVFQFETYLESKKLLTFFSKLTLNEYLLSSSDPLDQTVSLPNIINGFYALHQDVRKTFSSVSVLFDCILCYERNWLDAIKEYEEKSKIHIINNIKLAAIVAKNGAVSKVSRWQDRPDVVVFQDEEKLHVSISLNRMGRLKNSDLQRLAARMRAAEVVLGNLSYEETTSDSFFQIGELLGWFLHQSKKLLIHGSPKAHRDPSSIPFPLIVALMASEFDKYHKLPDCLCPSGYCLHKNCVFYSLRLPNCFSHRQNLRELR